VAHLAKLLHSASKLDRGHTTVAAVMTVDETSSRGSVALLVQLLHGHKGAIIVVTTTTAMEDHPVRGPLVAEEAIATVATGKVDTEPLPEVPLHGSDSKTLLHHPHPVDKTTATAAIPEDMEAPMADTAVWELLLAWAAALEGWVLHRAFPRCTAAMEIPMVALLHHHRLEVLLHLQ